MHGTIELDAAWRNAVRFPCPKTMCGTSREYHSTDTVIEYSI